MKHERLIFPGIVLAIVAAAAFIMWAGNDFQPLRSARPPFQVRYDMYYQTKVTAQEPDAFFADGKAMRDHVPGTVPRDGYLFTDTSYQQSEQTLHNPFPSSPPAVLARGKNRFNAFCSPCHSTSGQDTTEVVRRGMQKPPNLAAAKAKGYTDAHLYYIISKGQNIMPGYADKLPPEDRWAVVTWVRRLQQAPLKYPDTAAPAAAQAAAPAAKGE